MIHTKAILTDIEGTTSSISFVMEVLFPFARKRMSQYLRAHEHELLTIIDQVRREVGQYDLDLDGVAEAMIQWIDTDQKITPLKAIQGMIWKEGYQSGEIKGHMYPDAVAYLRQWKQAGLRLYVYSSGSVVAQKLLFGHTEWGDLNPLFSGYFDTTTGPKKEPDSYSQIATKMALPPARILFLSDHPGELLAAQAAGMQVVLLDRDRHGDDQGFASVAEFGQIILA